MMLCAEQINASLNVFISVIQFRISILYSSYAYREKVLIKDVSGHPASCTQNNVNVVFTGHTVFITFNGTTGDEVDDYFWVLKF